MSESVQYNTWKACENCGRFGAFDFGDLHLCSDCYEARGSCCLEFGGDDLWEITYSQPSTVESPSDTNQGAATT